VSWASAATSSRRCQRRWGRKASRAIRRASRFTRTPATPIVAASRQDLSDELGENLPSSSMALMVAPTTFPASIRLERGHSIGSIVRGRSAEVGRRPADRAMPCGGGWRLSPSRHLEQARFDGAFSGGDMTASSTPMSPARGAGRAGIVERIDADHWRLPEDFESRAAAYDCQAKSPAQHSRAFDLRPGRQIEADGADWLDRRLVGARSRRLVVAGFGPGRAAGHGSSPRASVRPGRRHPSRPMAASSTAATCSPHSNSAMSSAPAQHSLPRGPCRSGHRRWRDGAGRRQAYRPALERQSRAGRNAHEFTLVPWRPGDRKPASAARWDGVVQGDQSHGSSGANWGWGFDQEMRQTMS